MVALRECSGWPEVATVHGMERQRIRPAVASDVPAGKVFVTDGPGGGVAGLVVVEARPDHLFLDSIAVHPDAHGGGVGRRLLRFVDAHARALGLPEVRLYTNAMMWENREIYPKYGYEVVERRVDGPYDRVHYRKRLL